jgi:hypothetical protein
MIKSVWKKITEISPLALFPMHSQNTYSFELQLRKISSGRKEKMKNSHHIHYHIIITITVTKGKIFSREHFYITLSVVSISYSSVWMRRVNKSKCLLGGVRDFLSQ